MAAIALGIGAAGTDGYFAGLSPRIRPLRCRMGFAALEAREAERLEAWREAGVSTLVMQTRQREALQVMAELLL